MSKVNCEFIINYGLEEVNSICRKAFNNNSNFTASGSNNEYTIKETQQRTDWSTTWPATSVVKLECLDSNTTKVFIKTSNFGFGPIQSNYCKQIMGTIQNIIISEADNRKNMINNTNETSIIEKIKQLSALKDNGILTQEEFETKKSELLSKV